MSNPILSEKNKTYVINLCLNVSQVRFPCVCVCVRVCACVCVCARARGRACAYMLAYMHACVCEHS